MSEKKPFLRAAGVIGVITLASRILGLVRDAVVAACLGATRFSDVFWIAFEVPNLMRRVLGEGSLSAFLVPIFTGARADGGERAAWRFAANVLTTLTVVTLLLTLIGLLFAEPIFSLLGYGFAERGDTEAIDLGVRATRIMLPFVMLLTLSSILMGLCHSIRHFAMPALGSVVLNIFMIVAGGAGISLGWTEDRLALALAWSVLAAGVVRLLIMMPPLHRAGFRYRPRLDPVSPRMRELYLMLLPALFGMAVVQINVLVSRAFATKLGPGYATCLIQANRLLQFPLAFVASALATAVLPQVSQHWVERRLDDLSELTRFAFRLTLILCVPATIGLMALGEPMTRVLIERMNWDAQDTLNTYQALLFYAPSLVVWGMLRIITPIFYAQKDVWTPVLAATLGMFLNIGLNAALVFIAPLREALGHAGLALANTISVLLNGLMLIAIQERRQLALWNRGLTLTAVRTCAAGLIMGVAAFVAWRWIEPFVLGKTLLQAGALALAIALATALYLTTVWLFGESDVKEAFGILLSRGRGRRRASRESGK